MYIKPYICLHYALCIMHLCILKFATFSRKKINFTYPKGKQIVLSIGPWEMKLHMRAKLCQHFFCKIYIVYTIFSTSVFYPLFSDPIFSVSGPRDHMKAAMTALMTSGEIVRSYFSSANQISIIWHITSF